MKQGDQRTVDSCHTSTDIRISRRLAMSSSGLAVFGLLSGSALGQAQERQRDSQGPDPRLRRGSQERMEQFKAYSERMRNASPEERMKLMMEQRVQERQRAIEDVKDRLGISDREWPVVKPRIEKVYNLVHPLPQMGPGDERPRSEVEQASRELREVLRDEAAAVDQVKAKLTALRAAKEKANQELATARQGLRQLMTVRQEAELVLSGLLD